MNFDKKNIIVLVIAVLLITFLGSFLRQPKIYSFSKEQFVPSDMETVFDFFSRPENLEKITPSSMGFNIITPKPIELLENIIHHTTDENDMVLDCFAGSGSMGYACMKTNRKCILIEKEKKYCDYISDELKKY